MNKLFCALAIISGFAALALLAAAGPAYRLNWLELGQAFALLRLAAVVGAGSVVLIIAYSYWRRPEGRVVQALAFSALAGFVAAYIPLSQLQNARKVPPIHDVSTDLTNPPEFVDILPLRAQAPNPPEYAGEEVARLQREAYPNILPLTVQVPMDDAYLAAQEAVRRLGWQLVAAVNEQGTARIEATDTTRWFGFKDDVVVRLQATPSAIRVDVRSKSRVGQSDLGKNAERINEFSGVFEKALAGD